MVVHESLGAITFERVLSCVEALELDLAGLRDRLTGQVAVGAFPAACAVLVPRALATVREAHPGLRLTLLEAFTPALLGQLRSGRLQVAVVGVGTGLPALDLDGVVHEVVSEGDLCVAVPDGHRLASASRVPVAELHGESWVVGRASGGEPQFGAWPTLQDPVIGFAVRGWSARLGLVAADLGICLLCRKLTRCLRTGRAAPASPTQREDERAMTSALAHPSSLLSARIPGTDGAATMREPATSRAAAGRPDPRAIHDLEARYGTQQLTAMHAPNSSPKES